MKPLNVHPPEGLEDGHPQNLPAELSSASGTIRIPELRNIALTRRVQHVIDHPAFQRLRSIRQLGPTHLVYPGAVHTRFEHSLGVYGCTQWFLLSLLRDTNIAASLTESDMMAVMAAALLHDLGHYPYAHSLEALHLKGQDTPRHEEVGARIIRGEIDALRGEEPIAKILERDWRVDPERVIRLCTGALGEDAPIIDRILRSIISGAIDADKMDYLERDAHHMGVAYGRHYDRQRLLASLRLNQAGDGIGIAAKGKISAEMFIFSRYTMFSEAYWHHTVRAASAMVESALAAFYSRSPRSPEEMLEILLTHHDDAFMEWLIEHSPQGSATRHLLSGLTGWNRSLYKRVLTLSRVYLEDDKQRAYDRIYHMDHGELYGLVDRLRVTLSSALGHPLHPASLIFDTPPRDKDKLESIELIYPNARGQRHYPLHQLSRIVAGVQHDFIRVVKKIRLFAEPSIAARIKALPEAEDIIMGEILAS